jgi:iron-sulfur cluster insertion protein
MKLDVSAERKIKDLLDQHPNSFFRVTVSAGGCNGFQHSFEISSHVNADDIVISSMVVVDSTSLDLLQNSVLTYQTDLSGSSFELMIPNLSSSCGCGQSWSL